jgi:hypothetical protein
MGESIYKVVSDCFYSDWIRVNYLLGYNIRDALIEDFHFDKVTSLSELLDNLNNVKMKYKSEFEKLYDLEFIEGFIEEYDKRMKISEKYKDDTILIFSILFGFLVDFDYIQTNERIFRIQLKTGEIIERTKVVPLPLKGKKNSEIYKKILNRKSLMVYEKPGIFLDDNIDIKDYVNYRGKKRFLYLPDYVIIALLLYRYAEEIRNKNTKLLIKGQKKRPTYFDYAKELYPNKKDFSELTGEETKLLFEKNDKYIEFFELQDIERLGKICDEINNQIELDKENNPYFNENIFKVYPNLSCLKSVVREMNGSLMMSAGDFFAMGGQLK